MSAAALLAAMLAAVHAQHSVRYMSTTTSGATKVVVVADVAPTEGIQRITFTQSGKTGHITVLVSNRTAYFRGDAFALRAFMGIAADRAQRYAGDWVRVPHTAKQYANVASDVTLPSFTASLAISGTVEKVKGGIRDATSTGSLTVLLARNHLPTRETGKGTGGSLDMTMSRWNEAVRVPVPAKTVPASEVFRPPAPGA